MILSPRTPRPNLRPPTPLTGWAKTRKMGYRKVIAQPMVCQAGNFRISTVAGCNGVAPLLHLLLQRKSSEIKALVGKCNGATVFLKKGPLCARMCARAHAPTRAHRTYNLCCTVAPLHLYYKPLITFKKWCNNRCNNGATPLRLCLALPRLNVGKPLVLLDKLLETFVYRGLMA